MQDLKKKFPHSVKKIKKIKNSDQCWYLVFLRSDQTEKKIKKKKKKDQNRVEEDEERKKKKRKKNG